MAKSILGRLVKLEAASLWAWWGCGPVQDHVQDPLQKYLALCTATARGRGIALISILAVSTRPVRRSMYITRVSLLILASLGAAICARINPAAELPRLRLRK
jgi:hypothetical protein